MSDPFGVSRSYRSKYPERPQYPLDASSAGQPGRPEGGGRAGLYVGLLWLYVLILAVGTVAELLGIQWILDLPIY